MKIEEARALSSYLENSPDAVVKRWMTIYEAKGYKEYEKNWDARIAGQGMFANGVPV